MFENWETPFYPPPWNYLRNICWEKNSPDSPPPLSLMFLLFKNTFSTSIIQSTKVLPSPHKIHSACSVVLPCSRHWCDTVVILHTFQVTLQVPQGGFSSKSVLQGTLCLSDMSPVGPGRRRTRHQHQGTKCRCICKSILPCTPNHHGTQHSVDRGA